MVGLSALTRESEYVDVIQRFTTPAQPLSAPVGSAVVTTRGNKVACYSTNRSPNSPSIILTMGGADPLGLRRCSRGKVTDEKQKDGETTIALFTTATPILVSRHNGWLGRLFIPEFPNTRPLQEPRRLASQAMRDPPEPWLCRTILQVAAYRGYTAVVESQISAGVAVDETDERGKTALMFTSWNGHLRAVQLLLNAGTDVNRTNRIDSSTALLYAVERGLTGVVDALLAAGAWTDAANGDGQFPLTIACDMGFTAIVKKLIAAGANVNQPSLNEDADLTPLMYASRARSVTIMEMLLKAGASVDTVDQWDRTALIHACHDGLMDSVSALVAAGADIRHVSATLGGSALHGVASALAHAVDNFSLIDIIIAEGATLTWWMG
jgi:ankyrin repeat protein